MSNGGRRGVKTVIQPTGISSNLNTISSSSGGGKFDKEDLYLEVLTDNWPTPVITITTQPVNTTILVNNQVSFNISASVSQNTSIYYQWQKSEDNGVTWNNLSGSTSNTITLSTTTMNDNGLKYRVLIAETLTGKTKISNEVTLTVIDSINLTYEYLIVAGGGGGSPSAPTHVGVGGGGGGGYRTNVPGQLSGGTPGAVEALVSGTLSLNSSFNVTVGGGGGVSGNGGASSIAFPPTLTNGGTKTSTGGGAGGGWSSFSGQPGGSGGGGANSPAGAGTPGQGHNGGAAGGTSNYWGGGGGGAGAVGGAAPGNGGNGGSGRASPITGTSVTRAGGGSGGVHTSGSVGAAGAGGGSSAPSSGSPSTGGGGGGASRPGPHTGGNGGSGIVILRYSGPRKANGGSVTSSGGYTIHTFTSTGTFTITG
jgi:hypothetical protein